ncbi:protein toll-like [Penaeus japonicus]|uniref:protein toll-like n=1 Tax=Penaeus japonicus TaxID=27405 RepID=UPI001C70EA81|nr:protein toll-like [Penaeus japonicus]
MMSSWMVLPAFLLWGWAAGGVTHSLSCGLCEGGPDGYTCPNSESEEKYVLRALPDQVLRVECHNLVRDFSLMKDCNLTTFRQFEFERCPLPSVSFGEVFRRIGVPSGNVRSLSFTAGAWNASSGLQEWHLDSLTNLQTLQLVDNNFTSFPPALLTNTPKLKFFSFIGNQVDSLPHTMLASTPDLVMADLGNNGLATVPEDLFVNLTKLTNVSLWNNQLTDIQRNLFPDIPNLKFLDLRDNLLSAITNRQFRGMKILKRLNLGGNRLSSLNNDSFLDLRSLEELELHSNLLEKLPSGIFDNQRLIKKLILRNNSFSKLPDKIFQKCESLNMLDLSYNNLQYIERLQLPGPTTSLTYLDLGNNNISFSEDYISESGAQFIPYDFPISNQLKLQHIFLDNNRINHIPPSFNNLYLDLETIDLSGNLISYLEFRSIHFLSDSVKLNLKNNKIKVINLRQLQIWPKDEKCKNVTLSLEGNPLLCNCLLYIFAKIVQGKSDELSKTSFKILIDDADKVTCTSLENRKMYVKTLDFRMLTCQLEHCLGNCTCEFRRHDEMLIVDCSFKGMKEIPIPNDDIYNIKNFSVTLNLMNNNITNFDGLEHPFYSKLVNLTIPYNKISHFNESDLPEHLKVLDVRGNNLTLLSATTLDYLNVTDMTLSLGDNPWTCNCELIDFFTFLQVPERKVLDQNNIKCASDGELLLNINEYTICPSFRQPMVIVTIVLITVFLLLFAVLGTMSFYKYKQGIKVWLFTHRMCLWAITEDELDADKKYDAFISYSHKDEEFVNTVLVPGLESGDPKYRICLHYRDWIPGEYIQNQILQSVEDSRRTIVVLSSNFIESVWGQLEFKAAHSQALQDRTNRIIVIVYGQVPPESELDEKLRLYISMKTYVKWGDAKFWEKLRYIMPHPQELIQKKQQKCKNADKLELVKSNSKSV